MTLLKVITTTAENTLKKGSNTKQIQIESPLSPPKNYNQKLYPADGISLQYYEIII